MHTYHNEVYNEYFSSHSKFRKILHLLLLGIRWYHKFRATLTSSFRDYRSSMDLNPKLILERAYSFHFSASLSLLF